MVQANQKANMQLEVLEQIESTLTKVCECVICTEVFKEATMTKCGHSFCKACIGEVVSRLKTCPVCKTDLTPNDLMKNFELGALIEGIEEKITQAKQRQYENMINQIDHPNDQNAVISPIVKVFKNNFQSSLASFQKYHDEQQLLRDRQLTSLSRELDNKKKGFSQYQAVELATLDTWFEDRRSKIELHFSRSIQFMCDSYEGHMQKMAPVPQYLPIRIDIKFTQKQSLTLENIVVQPFDNSSHLVTLVGQVMKQRGDPVESWNLDSTIFEFVDNPLMHEEQLGQGQKVVDMMAPIASYNLAQGSILWIQGGDIKFKSEKPPECMTLHFSPESDMKYNYFSCKQCGINWVCQACKEHCHEKMGHECLPHLQEHKPTFPCCYCVKKGKCTIKNMKNKPKPQNEEMKM